MWIGCERGRVVVVSGCWFVRGVRAVRRKTRRVSLYQAETKDCLGGVATRRQQWRWRSLNCSHVTVPATLAFHPKVCYNLPWKFCSCLPDFVDSHCSSKLYTSSETIFATAASATQSEPFHFYHGRKKLLTQPTGTRLRFFGKIGYRHIVLVTEDSRQRMLHKCDL
jgi:hypothetical protein